ncbi:hypothetical protein [Paenibacillus aceti]|uniref:YopX protein domain-containing protein n=1 Tax=Paenibacillus aceti TaxID=1820010 RepID=A0ABQ1VPJ1_9BACL|nr:hypothetical protein [Paenibacillus aceti]GGF87062.1 hypothetical protein GCM10010913_05680 [Paenibacillus aceti]
MYEGLLRTKLEGQANWTYLYGYEHKGGGEVTELVPKHDPVFGTRHDAVIHRVQKDSSGMCTYRTDVDGNVLFDGDVVDVLVNGKHDTYAMIAYNYTHERFDILPQWLGDHVDYDRCMDGLAQDGIELKLVSDYWNWMEQVEAKVDTWVREKRTSVDINQ